MTHGSIMMIAPSIRKQRRASVKKVRGLGRWCINVNHDDSTERFVASGVQ